MDVKTTSDQPHLRTARTPYTTVTLRASAARSGNDAQRTKELTTLALLVRVLNPKRDLARLNELLRQELETKLPGEEQ